MGTNNYEHPKYKTLIDLLKRGVNGMHKKGETPQSFSF